MVALAARKSFLKLKKLNKRQGMRLRSIPVLKGLHNNSGAAGRRNLNLRQAAILNPPFLRNAAFYGKEAFHEGFRG
ncbi:MAG: hypothetical protein KAH44_16570 [Oricola sp.]|jgi:hypothetical protein|nr:hypothetical protein [Oricola sp.]